MINIPVKWYKHLVIFVPRSLPGYKCSAFIFYISEFSYYQLPTIFYYCIILYCPAFNFYSSLVLCHYSLPYPNSFQPSAYNDRITALMFLKCRLWWWEPRISRWKHSRISAELRAWRASDFVSSHDVRQISYRALGSKACKILVLGEPKAKLTLAKPT